jgi:hypothetical protein
VLNGRRTAGVPLPSDEAARWITADQSLVAIIESARWSGFRHLVVPEGSLPWFRQKAELRRHLARHLVLADEPGAGIVYDLSRPAGGETPSLSAVIDDLGGDGAVPAVLDWTDLTLAEELPGLAVFRPPAGDTLPYLDTTVDVVVIDDPARAAEAARVSSLGVITVAASPSGARVVDVDRRIDAPTARAPVVLWSAPTRDPRWEPYLDELAKRVGARMGVGPLHEADVGDGERLVLVEPYVVPLPEALAAAATEAEGVLAGKVLQADGRLDAAGATVFADRSVGLVGHGSPDVAAPWHDHRRPVCWGSGLVTVPAEVWRRVPAPPISEPRAFLREWCANLWAQGGTVEYVPSMVAVRVHGEGGEPSIPVEASAWQRVLDLRPKRPPVLSDGAWRYVLAHDDVEAVRG